MKPYAQEAENLRLLFDAGLASVDDVVAWADRTILILPDYDEDLTEISLGAKLPEYEMTKRLRRLSTGADRFEAIRNLAGRMHQVLLSDKLWAEEFAGTLTRLYYENDSEFPEDLAYIWDEDVRISKIESGYGWLYDNLIAATAPFDTGDSEKA